VVSKADKGRTLELRLAEEGQTDARTLILETSEKSGKGGFEVTFPEKGEHKVFMKNVRVYMGKTLDAVSYEVKDGKISATIEFLNDGKEFSGGQLFMSIYSKGKLQKIVAVDSDDVTAVQGFGKKTFEIRDVETVAEKDEDVSVKFYFWSGFEDLSPVTEPYKKPFI